MKEHLLILGIGLLSMVPGSALAQGRYSAPPAAVLSGDLASPWILQLKNKPTATRPYSVTIRPAAPRAALPMPVKRAAAQERVLRLPGQLQARPQTVSVQPAPRPESPAQPALDPEFLPQIVSYTTAEKPGTLIVDTAGRHLYLVMEGGMARRYGVGVGRDGFQWSGTHKITRTAEWPDWRPPAEMIEREARKGKHIPEFMEGGPDNPLGARALYIGDTLYRIHGTNQPWSIGKAVSSGCIRMRNEDVIDLFERVGVGTRVVVS